MHIVCCLHEDGLLPTTDQYDMHSAARYAIHNISKYLSTRLVLGAGSQIMEYEPPKDRKSSRGFISDLMEKKSIKV